MFYFIENREVKVRVLIDRFDRFQQNEISDDIYHKANKYKSIKVFKAKKAILFLIHTFGTTLTHALGITFFIFLFCIFTKYSITQSILSSQKCHFNIRGFKCWPFLWVHFFYEWCNILFYGGLNAIF